MKRNIDLNSQKRRVLVIGLDGATFDLVRPWSREGKLPNLTSLMKEGCSGELRSTIQPTTAPAWSTFMTGVNQGKHSLYDFVRRKHGTYRLEITNGSHIQGPTIFQLASDLGRKVISINVPYTFPPRPLNGIMVGGPFVPTTGPELVYPPEFYSRLKQVVPDYKVLPDYDSQAKDSMADYAEKLIDGIKMREKLAASLLQSEEWDLLMVVFMESDEVQHSFWECMDAAPGTSGFEYSNVILEVYQRLDQAIGNIINELEARGIDKQTTIIVLSDHGAGSFRLMINLNQWLAQAGFLKFRQDSLRLTSKIRNSAIKRIAYGYRHYVPPIIRKFLREKAGSARFEKAKGSFESALTVDLVDWTKTSSYSIGAGGNLFINLKGREPDGIIEPGSEYENVRDAVIESVSSMRDPFTGERMVENVFRKEEIYSGPHLDEAPDLIIKWSDYGYWGRGQYDADAPVFERQRHFDFSDQPLTGSHRLDGMMIVHGPKIRKSQEIAGASILDMAPTILNLLGIAAPTSMDGKPLSEIFTSEGLMLVQEHLESNQSKAASEDYAYDAEMEEKISEHLRSLGYL